MQGEEEELELSPLAKYGLVVVLSVLLGGIIGFVVGENSGYNPDAAIDRAEYYLNHTSEIPYFDSINKGGQFNDAIQFGRGWYFKGGNIAQTVVKGFMTEICMG